MGSGGTGGAPGSGAGSGLNNFGNPGGAIDTGYSGLGKHDGYSGSGTAPPPGYHWGEVGYQHGEPKYGLVKDVAPAGGATPAPSRPPIKYSSTPAPKPSTPPIRYTPGMRPPGR